MIAGSYDALGKAEKPHQHGTAIAGAIAAHARLMGAAPAAKILAIRAFGASGASAEATTMAILKSIEYASLQQARIINMSFAGPSDPKLSRHLAAAKAKGAVLIAASGNFGPKSPPQYPAADPNVIAVSATDADDKMFRASNIGPHIAVAAPGVDILLPSPGQRLSADLRHLVLGGLCQRRRGADVAARAGADAPTPCARFWSRPPRISARSARTPSSARAWSTPIRRSWRCRPTPRFGAAGQRYGVRAGCFAAERAARK